MRTYLTLLLIFSGLSLLAQWTPQYIYTAQAPASHNYTVLDQVADDANNLYITYSADPSKVLLVSKLDPQGNLLWTDTLGVPQYPQVNVTTGRLFLTQNKLYVFHVGYGASAAPVIAVYQTNGTFLASVNVSGFNSVWTYGVYGVHELPGGSLMVYYSYGDQFTANDTLYVKKFSNAYQEIWQQKYHVPKLTWHCPNVMDNNYHLYFSYTNDSVVGSSHFTQSYTRKIDTMGNVAWTNVQQNTVNRLMKKLPNGDLVLSGCNNPNGSLMGNNTGDIITSRINDANGSTVWTQTFNGVGNERDEAYALETDPLNNVYIGGSADIHDYQPSINHSVLLKYTSAGQLQNQYHGPTLSALIGIYLNPLQELLTVSILNNSIRLNRMSSSSLSGMDSLTQTISYPMGMTGSCSNANADLFFTYSEGHCGANHIQALRFCSKAICNPNGIREEKVHAEELRVYPNPATQHVFVNLPFSDKLQIEVYDLSGRCLRKNKSSLSINLEGLAPSVYLLKVSDESGTRQTRLVKE